MVGRLLPFRQKRTVGPFAFIDHMGPEHLPADQNFDVNMHPHIGLSTLTYLFEGSIHHKDSLGNSIEIKPGQVNWMSSGNGITHTEKTPEYLRHQEKSLHGLQIWVALPKALEQMPPSFFHADESEIPHWEQDGIRYKLIAGTALGRQSPVPVYSPLYLIEIKNTTRQTVKLGEHLFGESALYILDGKIESEGSDYEPKHILIAKDSKLCEFTMAENTTVYIFGGDAFAEERYIYWNFVASSHELIEDAKQRWNAQEFPKVPGETAFIPLPEENQNGLKIKKD